MSTGTNRERLEQNNALLEDIKTQIQNLPEAGGTVEGIKQFATIEEMNNSTGNKEGDLAVVYRSEVQNATVDSRFQTATFPETVVLDTAITGNVEVRYRAVDSSKMFECMGQLDSSNFMMNCYTETGEVRIQYTSSDGITYTRTDTTGNPVDFGTEIYYEMTDRWNDAIGKFIQVGESTFEGLYEYTGKQNEDYLGVLRQIITDNSYKTTYNVENVYIGSKLRDIPSNNNFGSMMLVIFTKQGNEIIEATIYTTSLNFYLMNNDNKYAFCIRDSISGITITKSIYNFVTNEFTELDTILTQDDCETIIKGSFTYYSITNITDADIWCIAYGTENHILRDIGWYYTDDGTFTTLPTNKYGSSYQYYIAPTQLSAVAEYVYGKEFYGKNGVEIGTLGTPDNSFADINAEIVYKIQNAYNGMEPRILTDSDKTIDKNIYFIPVKKDGTALLDTSSVTDAAWMFGVCTNLTTIPLLNTSNATNMISMFNGCTNLTGIPQIDTSRAIYMRNMFQNCTNLTTIPELNTSSVTYMEFMFYGCTNLTAIPQLDTRNVTDMRNMFYGCTNLTEIPLLDTNKVTNMRQMFQNCTNLTTVPLLNTRNVTDMNSMFAFCTNLTTIPLLDTSRAIYMRNMFDGCTNLTTIPLLNTSSVTYMEFMFYGCTNLTEIPQLNTSKVTNMNSVFGSCTNLTTIPLLDMSSVTYMGSTFYGCTSLSDESLNNILAMCANATSYNGTKTLKNIGLASEQATKCTTLSNYSAFTSAGWTTGY